MEILGTRLCEECKTEALAALSGGAVGVLDARVRHPHALLSLVIPIVGYATCLLIPLTSTVGLVLGARALREIQAQPRYAGRTLALAGLVVSGGTLGTWVVALVATLLFRIFE